MTTVLEAPVIEEAVAPVEIVEDIAPAVVEDEVQVSDVVGEVAVSEVEPSEDEDDSASGVGGNVQELPVLDTGKRKYTKRRGAAGRKFKLTELNEIRRSIKEVGIVKTAERFNTLAIYVQEIAAKYNIEVRRGRRPKPKEVASK